jgi:DNA-binding MarR family transcriptional regulator
MKTIEAKPEAEMTESSEPIVWAYEALKRFRLIFRAVQQHSQWVESCCGVSCAQLWAMAEVSKAPGIKVTELAQTLSVHQSTASNMLLKLEKKGLIQRRRLSSDQRVVCLYLSEAGQKLVAQAPDPKQGLLQHALFELPDPVLASLTENLEMLIETMQIRDEQAAMQPLSVGDGPSDAGTGSSIPETQRIKDTA